MAQRAGHIFVFAMPALLAVASLVRWTAGAISTSSILAVMAASLVAVLVAADGVSRASRPAATRR